MTKSCPSCGALTSGKFCSQCGTSLQTERVCECGNRIPADGRFCNMCGRPAPGEEAVAAATTPPPPAVQQPTGTAPRRSGAAAPAASAAEPVDASGNARLPWIIGGIAAAAVVAVLVIPRMGRDDPAPPPMANAPAAAGATTGDPRDIDLTTMTPEDAAIRLFTRVMTLAEAGDSAQARTFAPMAIDAYALMPSLTLDHRYDLAMIHFIEGNTAAAAAQADTILAAAPTHLFGLAAAAEAAARTGDTASARDYYQRYLDNYDDEVANNAVEYELHPPLPSALRMTAVAYLNATN